MPLSDDESGVVRGADERGGVGRGGGGGVGGPGAGQQAHKGFAFVQFRDGLSLSLSLSLSVCLYSTVCLYSMQEAKQLPKRTCKHKPNT
jgi:hypothetical protein